MGVPILIAGLCSGGVLYFYTVIGGAMIAVGILGLILFPPKTTRPRRSSSGSSTSSSYSIRPEWKDNRRYLRDRVERLKATPKFDEWLSYFRNHDDDFGYCMFCMSQNIRDYVSTHGADTCQGKQFAFLCFEGTVYYIHDYDENRTTQCNFDISKYASEDVSRYVRTVLKGAESYEPDDYELFQIGPGLKDNIKIETNEEHDIQKLAFMTCFCESVIADLREHISADDAYFVVRSTDDVNIFVIKII